MVSGLVSYTPLLFNGSKMSFRPGRIVNVILGILLFTSIKLSHNSHFKCAIMVSVRSMYSTGNTGVLFYGGAMDKEKKDDNSKDNKPIWKYKHTPLRDRKTSSGITFWPEKIEGDNDAD